MNLTLEYIIAGLVALANFASCSAIGCKLFMHDYDTPLEPFEPIIDQCRLLFISTLTILAIWGCINKIWRDHDPRNIFIYLVAVIQSVFLYFSTNNYEGGWFYSASIGLMHCFIYSFPIQTRTRFRMSKQMKKRPDKIKVSELQPVKQEKKMSKKKTEESSDEYDSDYSYEDTSYSSDDSYEYESESYNDDTSYDDYESSSSSPPPRKGKKKYSRRMDSSDYD